MRVASLLSSAEATLGQAVFFTTVQLLTVSSQIKNPVTAVGGRRRSLEVWVSWPLLDPPELSPASFKAVTLASLGDSVPRAAAAPVREAAAASGRCRVLEHELEDQYHDDNDDDECDDPEPGAKCQNDQGFSSHASFSSACQWRRQSTPAAGLSCYLSVSGSISRACVS